MGFTLIKNFGDPDVTATSDFLSASILNEIIHAHNERWIFANPSLLDDPTSDPLLLNEVQIGEDVQSVEFWEDMQTNVLNVAKYYFRDDAVIAGTARSNIDLELYLYDDFNEKLFTAAGCVSGAEFGFRRAPTLYPDDWTDFDDANYEFGGIVYGDIIGPWLVDDLQRVLSVLTATFQRKWVAGTEYDITAVYEADEDETCAETRSAFEDAWDAESIDEYDYEDGWPYFSRITIERRVREGRGGEAISYWSWLATRRAFEPVSRVRFLDDLAPVTYDAALYYYSAWTGTNFNNTLTTAYAVAATLTALTSEEDIETEDFTWGAVGFDEVDDQNPINEPTGSGGIECPIVSGGGSLVIVGGRYDIDVFVAFTGIEFTYVRAV